MQKNHHRCLHNEKTGETNTILNPKAPPFQSQFQGLTPTSNGNIQGNAVYQIHITLDLILTNMPHVYNKDLVQTFPPFGLSDHLVVSLEPKLRGKHNTGSRRSFTRRDTRASRKCELGRYFGSIDWSILDYVQDCESKLQLFQDLVKIGLDAIIPLKTAKLHVNDPP